MKVLVTGATGFIGKYVVDELLRHNHKVIASSKTVEEAATCQWAEQVEVIACDLGIMQKDFFEFFNKPDLLIHLAWEGLPNYNELFHLEKNLFSNYMFLMFFYQICGLLKPVKFIKRIYHAYNINTAFNGLLNEIEADIIL